MITRTSSYTESNFHGPNSLAVKSCSSQPAAYAYPHCFTEYRKPFTNYTAALCRSCERVSASKIWISFQKGLHYCCHCLCLIEMYSSEFLNLTDQRPMKLEIVPCTFEWHRLASVAFDFRSIFLVGLLLEWEARLGRSSPSCEWQSTLHLSQDGGWSGAAICFQIDMQRSRCHHPLCFNFAS